MDTSQPASASELSSSESKQTRARRPRLEYSAPSGPEAGSRNRRFPCDILTRAKDRGSEPKKPDKRAGDQKVPVPALDHKGPAASEPGTRRPRLSSRTEQVQGPDAKKAREDFKNYERIIRRPVGPAFRALFQSSDPKFNGS